MTPPFPLARLVFRFKPNVVHGWGRLSMLAAATTHLRRGSGDAINGPEDARIAVLVTGPDLAGSGGAGVQRHVRNLVEAFRNSQTVGMSPFGVTSNLYVEPWLVKSTRLIRRYGSFLRALSRVDVVHLNSTIDDRSVVRDSGFLLLARLAGRSTILQFHGGHMTRLRFCGRGILGRCVSWNLRLASLVLFLSQEQGEPVAQAFALNRVRYVSNYVDTEGLGSIQAVPHEGLNALYLGRLDPPKGILETLDGFDGARRPGWTLRVAGSGSLSDRVRQIAGERRGVEYVGFVDDVGRDAALAWADVLLLPSDAEGLPYAVLEAAAAGVALITSHRGALGSVTLDGKTGFVVPPLDANAVADALLRIGSDPDLLLSMKKNARDLVSSNNSYVGMRSQFEALYRTAFSAGDDVS